MERVIAASMPEGKGSQAIGSDDSNPAIAPTKGKNGADS